VTSMLRVLPDPPPTAGTDDVMGMSAADQTLAEVIRCWLRAEVAGDEGLVERLTAMAMGARADGAGLDETCASAMSLARSWLNHPSNTARHPHLRLVKAS
jgi:hypothetical protein